MNLLPLRRERATPPVRRRVLVSTRDEDGIVHREVRLTPAGGLVIAGHDLGPGVERTLGSREYEFVRSFTREETARIRGLLGVSSRDALLDAIGDRFAHTHELERLLGEHGLEGEFWSRTGD